MLELVDAEVNIQARKLRCSWKEDLEAPEQGLVSDPFSVGTEKRGQTWERTKRQEKQDCYLREWARGSGRLRGPQSWPCDRAVAAPVLSEPVGVARPLPCAPHLPTAVVQGKLGTGLSLACTPPQGWQGSVEAAGRLGGERTLAAGGGAPEGGLSCWGLPSPARPGPWSSLLCAFLGCCDVNPPR